ncbi:MAG TPA: hypothetical protein VMT69_10005 [Kineosporiaceae bacterium]|nr:hypothetical protein [Kineosporiaceae bacterium]
MGATPGAARRRGAAAGWTAGLSVFAALLLIMMGVMQALEGLAALIHGDFFSVSNEYAYRANTTAWGWGHLLVGILAVVVGFGIFAGVAVARYTGIAVAFVSAVGNFLFIPYYPFWAILLVALNIAVMWALAGFDPRRL